MATKRIWAARPLLIAYVIAVGFTLGLLINRNPPGDESVPAMARAAGGQVHADEHEPKEPPLWFQLFRPSQPTARLLLRTGMPLLAVADGSAADQNRNLLVYWTGRSGDRPQTLFQTMLPFLKPEPPPVVVQPPEPAPAPEPKPPGADQRPQVSPPPGEAGGSSKPVLNNGLPLVGIYHTHDWESYVSEFPAGTVKTEEDLNAIKSEDHKKRTVMTLGDVAAKRLRDLGVTTVHAPFHHRDLGYDYAYKSSRETAKKILKEAPSTRIMLDLHRDGVFKESPRVLVNGQRVAQLRCIIGTADQPHWQKNKAFCERIVARLERMYPGVTLPTREQGYTYNQDLLEGAVLFEVGNVLDRYEEAERSAVLLANALAAMIREGDYPR